MFAPTLNVPGPLITSFVEDQEEIFGEPMDELESPIVPNQSQQAATSTDLRSPRKQMFSDLPTPAYNQTQFQSFGAAYQPNGANDTGMIPMHPTYQMAPQGDGGYGSLNDALRSPTIQSFNNNNSSSSSNGLLVPKDVKNKRRESSMMVMSQNDGLSKKTSMLMELGQEDGGRF